MKNININRIKYKNFAALKILTIGAIVLSCYTLCVFKEKVKKESE